MQQEQLSEALKAAHESLKDRSQVSYEDFLLAVKDWECFPVFTNGVIVGAVLRNGPEIHACIKPDGFNRWFMKAQLKIMSDTVKKYGYATTSVTPGNLVGHEFVTRLGFVRVIDSPVWGYRKENHGI